MLAQCQKTRLLDECGLRWTILIMGKGGFYGTKRQMVRGPLQRIRSGFWAPPDIPAIINVAQFQILRDYAPFFIYLILIHIMQHTVDKINCN